MTQSEKIRELRDRTCISLTECKGALEKCDGDMFLAEGYLKYNGCAINIRPPEKYDEWVMNMARGWKRHLLEKNDEEK